MKANRTMRDRTRQPESKRRALSRRADRAAKSARLFLALAFPADLGQFDVVLMNPPFDRGRDCDHVRHAWQFVKPGGKLVAIMSARAEYGEDSRHKALHRLIESAASCYGCEPWHDLPPGSFAHAGTQVNTVALTLRKPRT